MSVKYSGRGVVPGTLGPKTVSRVLGIQRTKLYMLLAAGRIPSIDRQLAGRQYEIPSTWVAAQYGVASPEELRPVLTAEELR